MGVQQVLARISAPEPEGGSAFLLTVSAPPSLCVSRFDSLCSYGVVTSRFTCENGQIILIFSRARFSISIFKLRLVYFEVTTIRRAGPNDLISNTLLSELACNRPHLIIR